MSKRKRNEVTQGGGSPSNGQDSDGFEVRALQHQMELATLNTAPNNNNKKNDAKIKDQKFHGTNLPCFFNLAPAEAKLKELNASQNTKYRMFAFDRNAEGAKMYVIGTLEDFTAICFHRKISNKLSAYNYEMLMDGEPMKLYCDCEYLEVDNPGKDKDEVLCALLYYISQAYLQVPKPSNWINAELINEDFLVETCHRDGKVSYHVKIPEKFVVVTSMKQQRAFWGHVIHLADNDLKSNDEDRRQRAEVLRVFRNLKNKLFEDWVVDFSVYKEKSQCFRNLKAAKHPKQGKSTRSQDYLVPLNTSLQEITENYWKESLIMNVSSKATTLKIPPEWCNTNGSTSAEQRIIQVFNSDIHKTNDEDVRISELNNEQFKMYSSLLQAIDPRWSVTNNNQLQVRYGYLNPKVDILPKYTYIFPRSKYCPIKKGTHDTCCSWMKITQDGTMIISCFSSNHGGKPDYETLPHEGAFTKEKEVVMLDTWGAFRWVKELNTRYGFMKHPPISSKCIVEVNENGIEYHSNEHLMNLFANCRAYYYPQNHVKKNNEPSSSPTRTENETLERRGPQSQNNTQSSQQNQVQKVLKNVNPFKHWFINQDRRDINRIIFRPDLNNSAGDINTWHGFAVSPKQSDNPCPKLLHHIKDILTSKNEKHYDYLINWLAWMVKRPGEKTGVAVVFYSDQGTGKSTLVNVLQKIFGIHCLQITNSQHLFTPFSAHMDNRVLIVLNESTWGGDKAHEGWVKASITDEDSLSQAKFGDIKNIKNYWNLMFVSNQLWCYPTSEDNRRFFVPEVSAQRIGDHQYFNELHHELDSGGVEEFLYFLVNRQIPSGWKPAQYLPKRTKTNFEALMEDRKNSALKWFISKLKQKEWKEEVTISYDKDASQKEEVTLIRWNKQTYVRSSQLQKVWEQAREKNRELRDYATVKDMKQLKKFFEKLFDQKKELFLYESKIVDGFKTRCYRFANMQEVRAYITKAQGYDDWDDDDEDDVIIDEDENTRYSKKLKSSSGSINTAANYLANLYENEGMCISEDSNNSDGNSLENRTSNGPSAANYNTDDNKERHLVSEEELTSQHSLMECFLDSEIDEINDMDGDDTTFGELEI